MIVEIKQTNGKCLINGKPYNECTFCEQRFFIEFLNSFRYED